MGLPFVYTLKSPVHVSVNGNVHVRSHPDLSSGSQKFVRIPEVGFHEFSPDHMHKTNIGQYSTIYLIQFLFILFFRL